ncbi:hypothetical protein TCAL_15221 [Tigriopus californicus]|uniref:Deltamethrin resistance protein prag01 domain-containing protein n=1 Tax=Tigriopus californicus TaxID=6832 RepID=A0A553NEE7_TIGCA|nr:uncharacterized protein LOC131888885 [Tigriopus californicus]TRY63817.1 hypothetical protein TCAL_15221 [Tigriopus californicus]
MLSSSSVKLVRCGLKGSGRVWAEPPRRGMAALKNWTKPSMEEYGVPTESWSTVNAKRQARYNMTLLGGVVFTLFSVFVAKTSGLINFYTTPYHLLNDETTKGYKNEGDTDELVIRLPGSK